MYLGAILVKLALAVRGRDRSAFPLKMSGVGALCLLLIALFWTLSCGSTPTTPAPAPTPTPSPRQVIESSSARMIALDTARFTLEHEAKGSAQLFPGVELKSVKGEVDMPDRFQVRVEAESMFPRSYIEIDVVVVESQAFMTAFFDREKWNPIPVDDLPFNFADLGRTLGDIIMSLEGPTFNGTETVDGVSSYRVKGTIPSGSLSALIPKAAEDFEVALELWIGQVQGLLMKVRIEGQILSTDRPDVVRVLRIFGFDEPVEISLPRTRA